MVKYTASRATPEHGEHGLNPSGVIRAVITQGEVTNNNHKKNQVADKYFANSQINQL